MIATRFNPLGRKPMLTAKSYPQEGLVHHWDGIENVGYGLHDNHSNLWKDLVGDVDLYPYKSGSTLVTDLSQEEGLETVGWEDNCAWVNCSNPNLTYSGWRSKGTNHSIGTEFTMVACFTKRGGVVSQSNLIGNSQISSPTGVLVCRLDANVAYPYLTKRIGSSTSTDGNNNRQHFAIAYKDLVATAYIEGVESGSETFETQPTFQASSHFLLGCFKGNYAIYNRARTHNFLIYNRVLSQEEIAKICEIDIERFGVSL